LRTKQAERQNEFTSFVVKGFTNDGIVTMHHESRDSDMMDEHEAENEYAKLTVSEFIWQKNIQIIIMNQLSRFAMIPSTGLES
jgi:hypothetical protein